MDKGKIEFEASIPPDVQPLYQYHDVNKRTIIVGVNKGKQTLEILVYDGTSNIPTDIFWERKDGLQVFPHQTPQ